MKIAAPAWRRMAIALLVLLAGCGVWYLGARYLSVDALAQREQDLRSAIQERSVLAWGVAFLVYTLVSLFPGTSGKSIICGWFFGFWQSLLMVALSLTLAGLVGFSLSRYFFSEAVNKWLGDRVAKLDRKLEREGAFYMLTLRMLHVPFTLVNYSAGATSLPARTFAWTTLVGLIPSTAIFVGLGAGLPTLRELEKQGAKGLLSWPLVLALVLMGIVPFLLRTIVRKLRPGLSESFDDGKLDKDQRST